MPTMKTPKIDYAMKEIVESLEGDITIPAKLKDIIISAEESFKLKFDNPKQLQEVFDTYEEQCLFLI